MFPEHSETNTIDYITLNKLQWGSQNQNVCANDTRTITKTEHTTNVTGEMIVDNFKRTFLEAPALSRAWVNQEHGRWAKVSKCLTYFGGLCA